MACIVEDDEVVCLSCGLGLKEDDIRKHLCCICYETNLAPVTCMPCCKKFIHTHCSSTLIACPLCRATLEQHNGPADYDENLHQYFEDDLDSSDVDNVD